MVTASDGRPSPVTSQPFSAPAAAPASSTVATHSENGQPACHSTPSSALASPSTEATDRSISPATTSSVSASAISAISVRLASRLPRLAVLRNSGDSSRPSSSEASSSATSMASQLRK